MNWKFLLQKSHEQRMTALLYHNLEAICRQKIPAPFAQQLSNNLLINEKRNLSLTVRLLQILNLFEKNGIPSLPFKGPLLAMSAYRSLSLRSFHDLDILVQRRDFPRAKHILMAQGLRPILSHAQEATFFQNQFVHDSDRLNVDLHFRVMPRYIYFPLESSLWNDRVSISLLDRSVSTLSPEHTLLILSATGVKEPWKNLELICCAAELIRGHGDLNWKYLFGQAQRMRAIRMLLLELYLVHDLLHVSLPKEVAQRVHSDPAAQHLAELVYRKLFAEQKGAPSYVEEITFYARAREDWRDTMRWFLHFAITPRTEDRASLRLPLSLSIPFGLVRPLRFLRNYGADLISKLRREERCEP